MESSVNFLNIEYFFGLIYQMFFGWQGGGVGSVLSTDTSLIFSVPLWFKILSSLVSLLLAIGIAFFLSKTAELRRREWDDVFGVSSDEVFGIEKEVDYRWQRIIAHVNSESPAEWKVAIMEADKMLEELVSDKLQIAGENLGDRLKKIERSDFLTIDDAWDAHKVRNRIAHETGYEISQYEAKRIIGLFEKVFREFDFI